GKLAGLGLMGVCLPEEYGGAGADFLSYMLVIEELSRGDAGVGVTVAVHTSAVTLPLLRFGTEEQRARFVPPLARGEHLGAFALTEPDAGSDAGALRTRAEPDGDGWRISGAKQWITNGRYSGTFLLFARTDPSHTGERRAPGDPAEAREHVDGDRRRAAAGLSRRLAEGPRRAGHRGWGQGEAVRVGDGAAPDGRGDPDPRRLRLHDGIPGRAVLPRR